jgi:hypothetical protein
MNKEDCKLINLKTAMMIHLNSVQFFASLSMGWHLDVVRGPSTPHDTESDAGGSLSSWQATQAGKVKDEGRS